MKKCKECLERKKRQKKTEKVFNEIITIITYAFLVVGGFVTTVILGVFFAMGPSRLTGIGVLWAAIMTMMASHMYIQFTTKEDGC